MTKPAIRTLIIRSLAVFAVASGSIPASADDKPEPPKCDNRILNGPYGFTLTGWRIPAPDTTMRSARAGVGLMVFDGRGILGGSETKSHDGIIIPLTFTGTYTVYSDCTGTAHIVTTEPGQERDRNLNFVVVESGEQVMAIQSDQGRTNTVIATKQRAK